MTKITVNIHGASASARADGLLTARMIGSTVHFSFDAAWDGLTRKGYVKANGVKYPVVLDADGNGVIPWEAMQPGILYVGADGWEGDTIRIPTIWAMAGVIRESTADGTEADPNPAPSPSEVERITEIAQSADRKVKDLIERADAGEFKGDQGEKGDPGDVNPEAVAEAVTDYLQKHPVEVPTKTSQLTNDSGFLTEHQSLDGLQPKIDDLADIREGAANGEMANDHLRQLVAQGYIAIDKDVAWKNGYIKWDTGVIMSSDNSIFALVHLAAGETVTVGSDGRLAMLAYTTEDSVSVGSEVTVIHYNNDTGYQVVSYSADEDLKIVVSVHKTNYELRFTKTSNLALKEDLENVADDVSILKTALVGVDALADDIAEVVGV